MNASRIFDVLPPLALIAFGSAIAFRGSDYGVGSLTQMGPGFMAVLLGLLLVVLAAAQLFGQRHASGVNEATSPNLPWIPLALGAGSVVVWALLIERVGFIPAAIVQLILACLAAREGDWRYTSIGIVLFSLASYALFVWLLGLPVPAFGG